MSKNHERIHDLVYGNKFNAFITAIILLNAALIGIDTYPISEQTHHIVYLLEWGCVMIYILEIILKFTFAKSKKEYFSDAWNWFDIIIVGAAFVPAGGGIAPVLRILRVFRVLRLVKVIPELRLIVSVLYKSVASMTYIAMLMVILFYIYAIIGVKFFGESQPENYGTLHESLFSLFRSMTAEDWTDLRYAGLANGDWFWVTMFHVTWILMSTFVILNLVVGAIINNYHEVQEIEKRKEINAAERDQEIMDLMERLKFLMEAKAIDEKIDHKMDEIMDR